MKDATDNVPSPGQPSAAGQIAIPNDPRILGEFIANLLGQRRSIERQFDDYRFEIDLDWLQNLHHIIEQRLAAQNAAQLISFSARFFMPMERLQLSIAHRIFFLMSIC
jgi:hypothetical protein